MANAIKQLNDFDSPKLNFDAFETADFSTTNLFFKGYEVENALNNSLNTLKDFNDKIISLKGNIISLRNAGVSSTNVDEAFGAFSNKILSCNRIMNEAKDEYKNIVYARLEAMSDSELSAYQRASGVSTFSNAANSNQAGSAAAAMGVLSLSDIQNARTQVEEEPEEKTGLFGSIANWWNNDVKPWIDRGEKQLAEDVQNTNATETKNGFTSLLDGVSDLFVSAGAAMASVPAAGLDLGKGIYSLVTGKETTSSTKALWDRATEMISADDTYNAVVGTAYDLSSKAAATVATVETSIVEGVLDLGENIVDAGAMIAGASYTPAMLLVDGIGKLDTEITGREHGSVTKAIWEKLMDFVGTKHVENAFDAFYDNTKVGNAIRDNALAFDTTRGVTTTVGKIAGTVAITLATAGAGGVALGGASAAGAGGGAAAGALSGTLASNALTMGAVGGIAGLGRGAQDARSSGANVGQSLAAGALTGVKDAVIYGAGGLAQGAVVGGQALTAGAHVASGALLGAADPLASTAIEAGYSKGYLDDTTGQYVAYDQNAGFGQRFNETFNDNGGWGSVGKSALGGALITGAIEAGNALAAARAARGTSTELRVVDNASTSLDDVARNNLDDAVGNYNGGTADPYANIKDIYDLNAAYENGTISKSDYRRLARELHPDNNVSPYTRTGEQQMMNDLRTSTNRQLPSVVENASNNIDDAARANGYNIDDFSPYRRTGQQQIMDELRTNRQLPSVAENASESIDDVIRNTRTTNLAESGRYTPAEIPTQEYIYGELPRDMVVDDIIADAQRARLYGTAAAGAAGAVGLGALAANRDNNNNNNANTQASNPTTQQPDWGDYMRNLSASNTPTNDTTRISVPYVTNSNAPSSSIGDGSPDPRPERYTTTEMIDNINDGQAYDLSGLEYGRRNSYTDNTVHLQTQYGNNNVLLATNTRPDGTEMWAFRPADMPDSRGYAWFTKDEVLNYLNETGQDMIDATSQVDLSA